MQEVQQLVMAQRDDASKEFQSLRGGLQQMQKNTGQEQLHVCSVLLPLSSKEHRVKCLLCVGVAGGQAIGGFTTGGRSEGCPGAPCGADSAAAGTERRRTSSGGQVSQAACSELRGTADTGARAFVHTSPGPFAAATIVGPLFVLRTSA